MVNDTPRQWHKNQGQTWDWHSQGQGHTHFEATGLWSRDPRHWQPGMSGLGPATWERHVPHLYKGLVKAPNT